MLPSTGKHSFNIFICNRDAKGKGSQCSQILCACALEQCWPLKGIQLSLLELCLECGENVIQCLLSILITLITLFFNPSSGVQYLTASEKSLVLPWLEASEATEKKCCIRVFTRKHRLILVYSFPPRQDLGHLLLYMLLWCSHTTFSKQSQTLQKWEELMC